MVTAGTVVQTTGRPTQEAGSLAGEAGLAVWRTGDSVTVGWLTDGAVPGRIVVYSGGDSIHGSTTPADTAHRTRFTADAGSTLRLVYGGVDPASTHETEIRPDAGRKPRVEWPAPDSLVVISDIHGEFDRMAAVLRNAGILDSELRWAGGSKQLVIVGDVFDRGAQTTHALWFLYQLEAAAEASGGRMHLLLGNHELMVMLGDLRYLSSRDSSIARLHGMSFDKLYHPARSVIGKWLVGHPGVMKMGDLLFAHGGVSTDYVSWTPASFADSLFAFTHEELFNRWTDTTYVAPMDSATFARRWDFMWGGRSVFWYRGYARTDSLSAALDSILDQFDVRTHVVGHTPHRTITQSYGTRFIDVNTVPFVAEALLLVRAGDDWVRYRIRESGPPERLEPPS